jgi:hypothetical protein
MITTQKKIDDHFEHYEDISTLPTFQSPMNASLVLIEIMQSNDTNDYWIRARDKYQFLKHRGNEPANKLYKAIYYLAYMNEITNVIDLREELFSCRNLNRQYAIRQYIYNIIEPDEPDDISDYNPHWLTIYRKTFQILEYVIETFSLEKFRYLNQIFDITGTAQYLLNDLSLRMTIPIEEARTNPYIDSYTGTEMIEDETVKVPEKITLPDKDGNPVTVNFKDKTYTTTNALGEEVNRELIDDYNGYGWGGDLFDVDHNWNEEREITSVPISQMNEQEMKVTNDYYYLKLRFQPVIDELTRQYLFKHLVESYSPEEAEYIVKSSLLGISFKKALKQEFHNFAPQDLAAIIMDLPFDFSVNGNLDNIIDLFSDDILESIVESSGIVDYDEHCYEDEIELLHQETLQLLEKVSNDHSPKQSAIFTTEAFKAIAEAGLPIRKAHELAYEKFREISPTGLNAYRQALSLGKSPHKAMAAFYQCASQAGEYTPRDKFHSATYDFVKVKTASSGFSKIRKINWDIAKLKARNTELYVDPKSPDKSKRWLYETLLAKNWSQKLISSLAE